VDEKTSAKFGKWAKSQVFRAMALAKRLTG
jgi:hypothetical protein